VRLILQFVWAKIIWETPGERATVETDFGLVIASLLDLATACVLRSIPPTITHASEADIATAFHFTLQRRKQKLAPSPV
jgi:hypothetical protein